MSAQIKKDSRVVSWLNITKAPVDVRMEVTSIKIQ